MTSLISRYTNLFVTRAENQQLQQISSKLAKLNDQISERNTASFVSKLFFSIVSKLFSSTSTDTLRQNKSMLENQEQQIKTLVQRRAIKVTGVGLGLATVAGCFAYASSGTTHYPPRRWNINDKPLSRSDAQDVSELLIRATKDAQSKQIYPLTHPERFMIANFFLGPLNKGQSEKEYCQKLINETFNSSNYQTEATSSNSSLKQASSIVNIACNPPAPLPPTNNCTYEEEIQTFFKIPGHRNCSTEGWRQSNYNRNVKEICVFYSNIKKNFYNSWQEGTPFPRHEDPSNYAINGLPFIRLSEESYNTHLYPKNLTQMGIICKSAAQAFFSDKHLNRNGEWVNLYGAPCNEAEPFFNAMCASALQQSG